jgi:hypothetical protein
MPIFAAPIAAVLGEQPLGDEVFAAATRTATALVLKRLGLR